MKLAPGSVVCVFSPNSFYYRASREFRGGEGADFENRRPVGDGAAVRWIRRQWRQRCLHDDRDGTPAWRLGGCRREFSSGAFAVDFRLTRSPRLPQILCHPAIVDVALSATTALGWSKKKQRDSIVLAVRRDEAGPAGDCASFVGPRIFAIAHPPLPQCTRPLTT